jgi:hypothetical protein
VQQLREAFPLPCPYQHVLFDHDAKFGNEAVNFLQSSDRQPVHELLQSLAERNCGTLVGSVRHELLDYVIPLMNLISGDLGTTILPTISKTALTLA